MAGIFSKFLGLIGIEEEDEYEDEEVDYTPSNDRYPPEPRTAQPNVQQIRDYQQRYDRGSTRGPGQSPQQGRDGGNNKRGGNVVPHPSYEQQAGKHQTTIYQINEHTETRAVIDDLLAGKSVLLNLENLDALESQRVIDTLSGAAYAMQATIKKAAHQTYYAAPSNVEIGGNFSIEEQRKGASAPKPTTAAGNIFRSSID